MQLNINKINFNNFGPGLLLAATAIGVSHIVQSVQAGGKFGLILIIAIIFAHIVKYPFFLTSAKYTAHTKRSLLNAYFDLHPFLLMLFLLLTFISMFSLQALVTLITAAVFENIFHFNIPIAHLSILVLTISAIILFLGRYHLLDKAIKPIIIILFLATVTALIFALTKDADPNQISSNLKFQLTNKADFLFLVAFLGWMPCPLDCVVWNSVWNVKKQAEAKNNYNFSNIKLDFQVGYVTAGILAIIFLALGNIIFYQNNIPLDPKAVPFIGSFLTIYTSQFGQLAFYIVAIAALFTMFSTCVTCFDAFPRVISKSINILSDHYKNKIYDEQKSYNIFLLFTFIGTSLVLLFLLDNMKQLVMIATLTSFVSTAIFAILHQIINLRLAKEYNNCQMSKPAIYYANICVIILVSISVLMLYKVFSG